MSEKLAEVYEKYDIEILESRRGRGATILTTKEGYRILEPFRGSVSRLEQEYVLKDLLKEEGFEDMDLLIKNCEGELITYDRYHQPYVMKKHYEGEECDMRNLSDVVRAIEKLSEFHVCGKKVAMRFRREWENAKHRKEQEQIEEIKQALQDEDELEQVARVYGMSPAVLRELMVEEESHEETQKKGNEHTTENRIEHQTQYNNVFLDTFIRHNRELRKIRRFVGGVKRKNDFENLFLKVFPEYYNKGLRCEELFGQVLNVEEDQDVKDMFSRHYGICHGNYNQHNIIMGDKTEAIVHFERFSKGNQLEDLYQFARKVMEKNHFDYEMLEKIMDTYANRIELSKEDYRYMYVLFSYPEKFWKIANSYYNTNKAFLSPKYIEKLNTVIEQEREKSEMLLQYSSFHLQ